MTAASGVKRKIKKNNQSNTSANGTKKYKTTTTPVDKELSSSAQRRAVKQERQSHRRHATTVREAKEVWNRLRLKTNSKEQKKKLEDELMTLLFSSDDKNLVSEIALQHDASRVVQAAIQFATPEQRLQLTQALSSQMVEMSKNPYAHFCVLKVIQYGHNHDDTVRILLQSLKGHLCKLSVHAVGARVVEMLFSTLSSKQIKPLRQEFYGPHFSLFSNDSAELLGNTLAENLARHPQHESTACEYLHHHVLRKGIDKNLFGFGYFQQLLWEYIEVIKPAKFVESGLLSSLVDHALHLVSTRAGTKIVMWCIAYGTAKDRRKTMKTFKGYTRSSLLHRDAYLALLQLILVTDDTVTLHRLCLAEVVSSNDDDDDDEEVEKHPLLELALDENASKLLLLLLTDNTEQRQKYLDPMELEMLEINPKLNDEPTAKKDPEMRRKELLTYLTPKLKSLCLNHAFDLSTSIPGTKVLLEVYKNLDDDDNEDDDNEKSLVTTFLSLVTDEILEHPVGHYFLRHLISCETKTSFADALWKKQNADSTTMEVTNSRQAFVILSLLQQQKKSCLGIKSTQLKQLLKDKQKAKEATAGIEALLKFVIQKEESNKKEKKQQRPRSNSNSGSKKKKQSKKKK